MSTSARIKMCMTIQQYNAKTMFDYQSGNLMSVVAYTTCRKQCVGQTGQLILDRTVSRTVFPKLSRLSRIDY